MPRKKAEDARMLQEALGTAAGFNTYGVMSKTDMGKIRALCEDPQIGRASWRERV